MKSRLLTKFGCALLSVCCLVSVGQSQDDPLGLGLGPQPTDTEQGQAPAAPNVADFPDFFQQGSQLSAEELEQLENRVNQLNADARAKAEAGDLDAAIALYDEALAAFGNFISHYGKGRLLREQGYPEDAIQSFIQALGYAAAVDDAALVRGNYQELGQAYLDTEQYNTAIAAFTTAMTLPGESRNPELLFHLGVAQTEFALNQQFSSAQTRLEDLQKALVHFDRAISVRPDYPEALFERGSTYVLLNDLDSAIEDLSRSVELDPNNAEAVAQYGFASLRRALDEGSNRNGQRAQIIADLQQSIHQLSQYLTLVPEEPAEGEEEDEDAIRRENIFLQRSAAYIGLGDESATNRETYYQNAIADAEQAIELAPELPDGHYQKGLALRMQRDLEGALDAFDETLEISPANYEALLRRGIIHFRQGDYELAKSDFAKSVRFSAGLNPRAYFWLGNCYSRGEEPGRAVTQYTQALRYQPFYTDAHFNRGLAYMQLGRYERALEDFNEVLRRQRKNEQARSLRDQALQLAKSR